MNRAQFRILHVPLLLAVACDQSVVVTVPAVEPRDGGEAGDVGHGPEAATGADDSGDASALDGETLAALEAVADASGGEGDGVDAVRCLAPTADCEADAECCSGVCALVEGWWVCADLDCSDNGACPAGYACAPYGTCQLLSTCYACPPGSACDADGSCRAISCRTDMGCPSGSFCLWETCQPY